MQKILTDQDYKIALRKIESLLEKGSQGVSHAEISEITLLRNLASEYEKVRYDLSQNQVLVSEGITPL